MASYQANTIVQFVVFIATRELFSIQYRRHCQSNKTEDKEKVIHVNCRRTASINISELSSMTIRLIARVRRRSVNFFFFVRTAAEHRYVLLACWSHVIKMFQLRTEKIKKWIKTVIEYESLAINIRVFFILKSIKVKERLFFVSVLTEV